MSQPTIELVWRARGPALDAARSALRGAMTSLQLLPVWAEWKADDALKPRRLRCGGSGPCLYVNGHRAWTSDRGWGDEEALVQAIADCRGRAVRAHTNDPISRRFKYVVLPSAALALVPKCPLCWIAYASITTAFGLAPLTAQRAVLAALTLMLILGAAAVVWRSIQLHASGPVWIVSAGTILSLFGGHTQGSTTIGYLGLCTVLAAAVWSAWPQSGVEVRPITRP